jgi:hypothetical protein
LAFVDDQMMLTGAPLTTALGEAEIDAVGGTYAWMPCSLEVVPPGPVQVS